MDVSKEKLDVSVFNGESVLEEKVIANEYSAIVKYLTHLLLTYKLSKKEVLLCAEYTGHYIYALCLLRETGYRVWIENPSEIKYRSGVKRGKSDKLDARAIAFYGWRYRDKARLLSVPEKSLVKLRHLLKEREMYVVDKGKYEGQIKDQKNFMDKEDYKKKKERLLVLIEHLKEIISEIEEEIIHLIEQDQLLKGQFNLLQSVVGVGRQVALKMILETNAFRDFTSARKFCSHAGVAPFEHTSGSSLRGRMRVSHRADKSIKSLLHLAAMAAIRTEGEMKEYYLRKTAQGKAKMSVLNAIRAKLVLRMFAVIRENTPYDKNYQFSLA